MVVWGLGWKGRGFIFGVVVIFYIWIGVGYICCMYLLKFRKGYIYNMYVLLYKNFIFKRKKGIVMI